MEKWLKLLVLFLVSGCAANIDETLTCTAECESCTRVTFECQSSDGKRVEQVRE